MRVAIYVADARVKEAFEGLKASTRMEEQEPVASGSLSPRLRRGLFCHCFPIAYL